MDIPIVLSALLVGVLLVNPGCVAAVPSAAIVTGAAASAAATYTGYKASETKKSAAEGDQRSQDLRTYTQYCLEMEKINLEGEKAGLTPRPILTQEEWLSGQAAGPVEVAPPSASEPPTEPAADGNKIMKPGLGRRQPTTRPSSKGLRAGPSSANARRGPGDLGSYFRGLIFV